MARETCPFDPGARVWAYCRDSGGEEQQDSVTSQRSAIAEYCRQHNLVLVHVFVDEARPGSTTVGREGLEDLMYAARQEPQPVEGIIFWSFSRLARSQLDAQFTRSDLRRRGYVVHSMTDDVPMGEFAPVVEALIDWKNERFLKDLSRDVKRGLRDLAREGYAPGGFPPRGYRAEKVQIGVKRNGEPREVSRWVPDPELAPKVKQAFQMRANGASYKQIHEATQVMGSYGSYVTMFRNQTYLGIRKCGDLEIEDAHEPLVGRELWDAVQATLRTRAKKGEEWPEGEPHPRRAASPFLLSGLATCAECGAAMVSGMDNVSGNRKTPWPFYLCGRKKREGWDSCPGGKIGAKGPEQAVLQIVTEQVLTPDFVELLVSRVNEKLATDTPDSLEAKIKEKQEQLAEVQKSIDILLDLAEQFGAASAGPRLVAREAELKQLQTELQRLEVQREEGKLVTSPGQVQDALTKMRDALTGESIHDQRIMLAKVVVGMEMGPTSAKLTLSFPLSEVTGIYKVPPREFESLSPP